MGAPQWSAQNVAYLTVVAVVSCLVGYYGALSLNAPTTLYAPATTAVRPATMRAAAVPRFNEVEVRQPATVQQFGMFLPC